MGKNRKRKRNTARGIEVDTVTGEERVNVAADQDRPAATLFISDEALATTIETLQRIAQAGAGEGCDSSGAESTSVFWQQEKRFKPLRRALHPLILQQLKNYDHGTDYRIKVTQALKHRQWTDALAALQGCRVFEQLPKQGTIQRWVRDCDLAAPESCKLRLLHAVLVVGNQQRKETTNKDGDVDIDNNVYESVNINHISSHSNILNSNKHDPREAQQLHTSCSTNSYASDQEEGLLQEEEEASSQDQQGLKILGDWSLGRLMNDGHGGEDGEDVTEQLPKLDLESRILYRELAAERTPPNHYDLLLHTTTTPGTIRWDKITDSTSITLHEVPFLKSQKKGSAFLLENVLTVHECQQLIKAASALGYRPDHPTALDKPTDIDSCEWMVDDSILGVINHRVRPFLDHDASCHHAPAGVVFHSINPRWRFFRYGKKAVYRPHIDGSWPASRIDKKSGNYECYTEDVESGAMTTIKSYYTFLIYLNDNFEGGQTRFYFSHDNSLVAQGVAPKCGSVLVFSQGNTASLLHEGCAVTKGSKYVIRTDVLYRTSNPDLN